ncbi:glycine cleavage system protein GcvH [Candidatus Njordibacter sp. Uisw_002]|jgi:glycine cleavage system H protein|uniref:glycine cleavage system protein GcvH n=1 Tax=Candidatus Njordibacter sp. Uisw_002 TaxID=3230971 RepID=UPI003D4EAB4D|tara:strand:+ start:4701 stop:5093 length:393 start_codon:yes stop_codon:yes gene_type:complete
MNNIPAELLYTDSHEWLADNGDGTVTIGITHHAQELLGDIVFVEAPDVGRSLDAGEEYTVIESVKAASDSYAPIAGEIIAFNDSLEDSPEMVNEDPYIEGWIVKLKLAEDADLGMLLSAQAYSDVINNED